MAITKVGSDVVTTVANDTSSNVGLPAGLQQNDIVVVALSSDNDFDATKGVVHSGYADIIRTASGTPGSNVAWKRMGATPDTFVTITAGTGGFAGDSIAVVIQAWRGVDTTTAIDATGTPASNTTGLPNADACVTVTDGALRILTGHVDDDLVTDFTAPSGYTNMVSQTVGVSNTGATVVMASKIAATAGSENPPLFTGTGSDNWWATHFALRPAAETGKTVTADGGTYAISGTAASLELGRKVAADGGSYAISGQTAALERGYEAAAEAGSYTVSGTAATFVRSYVVTVEAGAYAISGQDAGLVATGSAPVLVADGGSYAISGSDAAPRITTRLLVAANGNYEVSGTPVTLTAGTPPTEEPTPDQHSFIWGEYVRRYRKREREEHERELSKARKKAELEKIRKRAKRKILAAVEERDEATLSSLLAPNSAGLAVLIRDAVAGVVPEPAHWMTARMLQEITDRLRHEMVQRLMAAAEDDDMEALLLAAA